MIRVVSFFLDPFIFLFRCFLEHISIVVCVLSLAVFTVAYSLCCSCMIIILNYGLVPFIESGVVARPVDMFKYLRDYFVWALSHWYSMDVGALVVIVSSLALSLMLMKAFVMLFRFSHIKGIVGWRATLAFLHYFFYRLKNYGWRGVVPAKFGNLLPGVSRGKIGR